MFPIAITCLTMKHYPTLRAHLPWDKPGKIHDMFHGPECEYIARSHLQYSQDSSEHGPLLPVWFSIVMSSENKFWPYLHARCLINKVMILYKMPKLLVHYCLLIVLVEEYSTIVQFITQPQQVASLNRIPQAITVKQNLSSKRYNHSFQITLLW
jgi:hypothetical protein